MSMKILQKYRPYLIPIIIITICVFWIVQLQLQANSLASRIEDLHNALKQNLDVLDNVERFYRSAKNNSMILDNSGAYLYTNNVGIMLEDKKGNLNCNKSDITWDADQIHLKNDNLEFHLSKPHDQLYLGDGDAAVRIGKIPGTSYGTSVTEKGIVMLSQPASKKGGYMLLSDKKVSIKSNNVPLTLEAESADFFGMNIDKKKELIELWNDVMRIYLDKNKERIYVGNDEASLRIGLIEGNKISEEGIIMVSQPSATTKGGYVLVCDTVLRIKSTDIPLEIVRGNCTIKIDDDKIEFTAESDINITSENGSVNLYGKRINFNEL